MRRRKKITLACSSGIISVYAKDPFAWKNNLHFIIVNCLQKCFNKYWPLKADEEEHNRDMTSTDLVLFAYTSHHQRNSTMSVTLWITKKWKQTKIHITLSKKVNNERNTVNNKIYQEPMSRKCALAITSILMEVASKLLP